MYWYLAVLKKYAEFSGRARRKEYWMFMLFNLFITITLILIGIAIDSKFLFTIFLVYNLAVLLPSLGVSIRRMHDIGKSGWWLFINCIPGIGPFILLVLTVMDSEPGSNQYGPNPKE